MSDTIDIKQIADLAHVTPKTARDRIVTRPDFPAPAFQYSQRLRAWRRDEVCQYLGLTDEPRSPRPSKTLTVGRQDG